MLSLLWWACGGPQAAPKTARCPGRAAVLVVIGASLGNGIMLLYEVVFWLLQQWINKVCCLAHALVCLESFDVLGR
jgi:hypothetical protein